MPLHDVVNKQIAALSPEQRQQIKAELVKNPSPANQELIAALDGGNEQQAPAPAQNGFLKGAGSLIRGAGTIAEGALLGLQNRPLSEGIFTGARAPAPDKYEELLRMEQLKNQVDPSRRAAQMKIDEANRRKEGQTDIGAQPMNSNSVPTVSINKGLDEFGNPKMENIIDPAYENKMAVEKSKAIEDAKPYSADEIKLASGGSLLPQIDNLIKLVNDESIYDGVKMPFGANRISAFGEEPGFINNLKKGFTAGNGRKAGLILQDIKQIMFATGGQSLTDSERAVLGPKLDPAYKTEDEWVHDLEDVRKRIVDKLRMLRPDPSKVFQGTDTAAKPTGNPQGQDYSHLW